MTARLNGSRLTKLRARWQARINTETVLCWRPECSRPIPPFTPDAWDLGHLADIVTGGDPRGPMLPECRSHNRSLGARLGNTLRANPARARRLARFIAEFFERRGPRATPALAFFPPLNPWGITNLADTAYHQTGTP